MSWNPQLMPCSACQNHPHQILQTPLRERHSRSLVCVAEHPLVVHHTTYYWLWICMQWVHTKALEASLAYFNTLYQAIWPCGCMRSHAHCSYPEHSSAFKNAPLWTMVTIKDALTFPLTLAPHNHTAHRNYNNHKDDNSCSRCKTITMSWCNKPQASWWMPSSKSLASLTVTANYRETLRWFMEVKSYEMNSIKQMNQSIPTVPY